ncbi:TonB-dependent receptor [Xanthomarina sp. F2636L]|uniref:TonB-dependent receptor n=1 Tax=Xanthomarina sp. F2636L TaxID=2996018 RepID=UPI00225DD371|nr:TonB-dependent receptor [Xanthomarina sp. F2636L]MCX7549722.1 TonB-dependent receptor [Xanthomarina sp. F2636L]
MKQLLVGAFLGFYTIMSFSQTTTEDSKFALGISTGYNRGLGVQLSVTALKPLENIPLQIRFGVGLSKLDPGNAADARRIFINNATNGVPEKKASAFDYRLDFMLDSNLIPIENFQIAFGPRYTSYKANFNYVGGNENFDVTSNQFGIGIGAESQFKINNRLNLLAAVGIDYYFNSTLKGHDTSYSPDNDNVNPRNDNENNNEEFTYSDADKAINQPSFMPRVLIGLVYML